jgi:tetratricopeptide (TPR) repeat protein
VAVHAWFGRAVAVAALLAGAAAAGAAAPANQDRQLAETLQAIDAADAAGDCPKVLSLGEGLLKARHGKLEAKLDAALEGAVAQCAYDTGAKESAYAHALRGTGFDESPDALWHLRLYLELETKKYAAAVATVEAMSQGRGAALNSAPMQWLYRLDEEMKKAGLKPERKRLLALLASDAYVPDESLGETQSFQESYAEVLADDGDAAGARAILTSLDDPYVLLDALFDPRVAALLPGDFDLRAVSERALAHYRALAERHPDRLAPIVAASAELRRLGRPQEALALMRPIVARTDAATAFGDANRKLNWAWDEIARASEALGRYDDAAKAFAMGGALPEQGQANVSQIINLAHLQVRFGHPDDALKTLAVFDDPARKASPYGLLEMRLARGCANGAAGRAHAAAADLAYAQAHSDDHPQALGLLQLCLGRLDDAAAFFIRALGDPNRRVRILQTLSDYDPPPVALPAWFGAKLAILKARADVKAAIAKAGGIRRIPFQEGDL